MIPQEKRSITEMDRIRDQFHRALEGITATQAAAHPIPGAHSIWELTLHIAAWERACLRRLQGDPARLSDEEDWRPIYDTSDEAWENTKKYLVDTHRDLLDAIALV